MRCARQTVNRLTRSTERSLPAHIIHAGGGMDGPGLYTHTECMTYSAPAFDRKSHQ